MEKMCKHQIKIEECKENISRIYTKYAVNEIPRTQREYFEISTRIISNRKKITQEIKPYLDEIQFIKSLCYC